MGQQPVDLKLLPCPFCGGTPVVETRQDRYKGGVFCVDADCPASDISPLPPAKWNRRAVDVDAILKVAEEVQIAVDDESWPNMNVYDYREAQRLMATWAAALRKACGAD